MLAALCVAWPAGFKGYLSYQSKAKAQDERGEMPRILPSCFPKVIAANAQVLPSETPLEAALANLEEAGS